jgi:O-antigen/teichoic acid export membrane protein
MASARASLLRQAGPLLLGRGGAAVLAFALPLVLTRLLSVEAYGTYKAAFLVATTSFFILQAGMAQCLYYFVPRPGAQRAALLTHSSAALIAIGALGALVLWLLRGALAAQFGNPDLARCGLPIALIAFTMVATAQLEVQLTAEGKVREAAVAILVSETVRIGLSLLPLRLGMGLEGLLWGNALHGLLRIVACAWLLLRRGGPVWHGPLWREQLAYSLPFGAAVLLSIPQQTLHQWAVGARVAPAQFAVYMVGCFQVPIINLLYSPISDVLQVRLAAPQGLEHAVALFHEASLRLAAVFLPLCAGLCAAGSLFIPALFTHRYDASVPIFRLALLTIPFASLPLDGTLRALGETRYLLHNSAAKLLVTAPAVLLGLYLFGPIGAISAHCAVEAMFRGAMLLRARRVLRCSAAELLPWRPLSRLGLSALFACAPVLAIARLPRARAHPWPWLFLAGLCYGLVYLAGLALGPGKGTPAVRIKRALLGSEPAPLGRAA